MNRALRSSLILLPIMSLCACAKGNKGNPSHSFLIYEENGVQIAETTGGPKYEGELFTYEKYMVLKEDPDNEDSFLFQPGQFLMDSDGFYYVADSGNQRIAVFNPEGHYIRSIGRKGEGPGEFMGLRLHSISNGKISVFDPRMDRTSLFNTDGTLIGIFSAPKGYPVISDYQHMTDDLYALVLATADMQGDLRLIGNKAIIFSAEGDSLWSVETALVPTRTFYRVSGGSGSSPITFAGWPNIKCILGKGLLLSTGADPILQYYDLQGSLEKEIRLNIPRVSVSQDERDAIIRRADEAVQQAREQNQGIERAEARRDVLHIPESKGFWTEILIDDKGYLWLSVPIDFEEALTERAFPHKVVNPQGEYIGNTRLPWVEGRIANGYFLTYEYIESTGALIPTVYRIRPAIEGLKYP